MTDESLSAFCHFIIRMRSWEREQAPLFTPQLGFDVTVFAVALAHSGSPACTKDFHLALNASRDRIREVILSLVKKNYLCCKVDPNDFRRKLVLPTQQAVDLVEEYRRQFVRSRTYVTLPSSHMVDTSLPLKINSQADSQRRD